MCGEECIPEQRLVRHGHAGPQPYPHQADRSKERSMNLPTPAKKCSRRRRRDGRPLRKGMLHPRTWGLMPGKSDAPSHLFSLDLQPQGCSIGKAGHRPPAADMVHRHSRASTPSQGDAPSEKSGLDPERRRWWIGERGGRGPAEGMRYWKSWASTPLRFEPSAEFVQRFELVIVVVDLLLGGCGLGT